MMNPRSCTWKSAQARNPDIRTYGLVHALDDVFRREWEQVFGEADGSTGICFDSSKMHWGQNKCAPRGAQSEESACPSLLQQ